MYEEKIGWFQKISIPQSSFNPPPPCLEKLLKKFEKTLVSPWQICLELELKTKGLSSSVNFLRRHVTKNGIFTQAPHSTCNILVCVSNVLTSLENNITQNLLIVLVHREWMMIIRARIFTEAYYIKHKTPNTFPSTTNRTQILQRILPLLLSVTFRFVSSLLLTMMV